ncbi:MAG: phenylacetic acid degradation protein [Burkholderiales bacterium]|nr:MAG: phenylacetic acid degradation protein [Betaproteobacteria bacterium]TAG24494.1 MAG: phenylacetic acid degradation protein [Burkholderiales bacterium]
MAQHFYPLVVSNIRRETADCVSIALRVPSELREQFLFVAGQYVNVRSRIGDQEIRRSYSICSAPASGELRIAVKRVDGGQFSQWANSLLREGDLLDTTPPDGRFRYVPNASRARRVLLLAAGSGITPMLSILTTLLETEPLSQVTLIYGNRRVRDIVFKESIEDLRDRFLTRFQLIHTLSGEVQESPLASGRLNAEKLRDVFSSVVDPALLSDVYVCGPSEMINECVDATIAAGVTPPLIHKELFGAPRARGQSVAVQSAASNAEEGAKVTVTADGIARQLHVGFRGESILEVALAAGIDAPFACKAGVCCTCRAQVTEGTVRMDANFTLEQDEIDRGFVLSCQAHPTSPTVALSFDTR